MFYLECVDYFDLVLFAQGLNTVMEQTVDVVFDFHDFIPIQRLQLPFQILQIHLVKANTYITYTVHLFITQCTTSV